MHFLSQGWLFLREIRAPYFAAIALPIVLGTAVAWAVRGQFNLELFVLSLLAGIFLQAGANMTDDFYDYQRVDDDELPWTLMPPQQVLQGALGFNIVGAMVGFYIAVAAGPLVLLLGVVGIVSGFAYSAPPFRLSGTGIGELIAALNLGLLTTLGAYYVQARQVDALVVWVALPIVLLMAATLILNGFLPAKLAANQSLWARLGGSWAPAAYALPALLAFAMVIVGVALDRLPQLSLLGLLGLPLAASAVVGAQLGRLTFAIVSAVGAHLSTTLLLSLAFLLQGLLQ